MVFEIWDNEIDPMTRFTDWWSHATANSPLRHKSSACLSTIDAEEFPNGRFVDLKAADESGFTFCTSLTSEKGLDIKRNSKVALTLWWDHVGLQVRVRGQAFGIESRLADAYWKERSFDAKLASIRFNQSEILEPPSQTSDLDLLDYSTDELAHMPRPKQWSGFKVRPQKIEFFGFRDNRRHVREQFRKTESGWVKTLLQP